MRLEEALHGVSAIVLDTAPLIYHLEGNPSRAGLMQAFFHTCATKEIMFLTTPITLAECLVIPLAQQQPELVAAFGRLITGAENTRFRPIGVAEANEAARLRADHRLRLADAFQAATALVAGCKTILTNDPIFRRIPDLRAIILDELEI